MAEIRWTGNVVAVAQVDTFTPANVEIGDIFTLTVTGLDGTTLAISYTAAAATVLDVTAGLDAAWNASLSTLCTGITALDNTTDLTLTADAEGTGFSVASTAVNGGATDDQTLTRAATTANAGPKVWDNGDNWSGGAVPGGAGSQNVYIEGAEILYGLDQSGIANTLVSLNIKNSKIGTNPADGYLPTYLQIKATAVNVGQHNGPGTLTEQAPIYIDTGSTVSTITVYNSGTNQPTTIPVVLLKANSASSTIYIVKGSVGVAYFEGETTTIASLDMAYAAAVASGGSVYLGSGVTVTTITKSGGYLLAECGATILVNENGPVKTIGNGAFTNFNVKGGSATPNSTGTIATMNLTGGTTDMTTSQATRTVSTVKMDAPAVFKYDPSDVTLTNKIQPYSSNGIITLTAA